MGDRRQGPDTDGGDKRCRGRLQEEQGVREGAGGRHRGHGVGDRLQGEQGVRGDTG